MLEFGHGCNNFHPAHGQSSPSWNHVVETQVNSQLDRCHSDSLVLQWIECEMCATVLEFPHQQHFCDYKMTLNQHINHHNTECANCFCVLSYPGQPHRCPDATKSRDEESCNTESDWYICINCACVLTSPQKPHSCLEGGFGIVEATNSLLFPDLADVPTFRRMRLWTKYTMKQWTLLW